MLFFVSLVLCQNNYLCGDDVTAKTYHRTNFLSNLCGSLRVTKSQRNKQVEKIIMFLPYLRGIFPVFFFFFPVNLHHHSSELEYSEK